MNQYKVIITFNDGDQVQSKVAAENQSEALARLMKNEQVIEFAGQHEDVKSVDISYIGEYANVVDDPQRFVLTPSKERDGWWVAADKKTNMVFIFMEGVFPDSVEYKPLEDMTPLDAATAVRELGDWLRLYHPDVLEERSDASRYINRKRIGKLIADTRRRQGLSIRELAVRSGVSYQNITKIENGRYNVSIDILDKLCKALGLKIVLSG
jgi:DNA-binding XRE family transcriptional regulator